jgi:hypothetical protein
MNTHPLASTGDALHSRVQESTSPETVAPCRHAVRAGAREGVYVIGDGVTLPPAGLCPWCGRDH